MSLLLYHPPAGEDKPKGAGRLARRRGRGGRPTGMVSRRRGPAAGVMSVRRGPTSLLLPPADRRSEPRGQRVVHGPGGGSSGVGTGDGLGEEGFRVWLFFLY